MGLLGKVKEKDQRFVVAYREVHKEGASTSYEVLVDRVTGVNYLQTSTIGVNQCGLCPLYDENGSIIVSKLY